MVKIDLDFAGNQEKAGKSQPPFRMGAPLSLLKNARVAEKTCLELFGDKTLR
jgi:hypothetical protein